jgi:hypothetical protein
MSGTNCTYIGTFECKCDDCKHERSVQACFDRMQECETRHASFSGTADEEELAYQRFRVEVKRLSRAWRQACKRRNRFISKCVRDSN